MGARSYGRTRLIVNEWSSRQFQRYNLLLTGQRSARPVQLTCDSSNSHTPRGSTIGQIGKRIKIVNGQSQNDAIRRVMVGTDRSHTTAQAVRWVAQFADRYGADLFVVQVILPQHHLPQNSVHRSTREL